MSELANEAVFAGSLVTTSQNYVNAHTGAVTPFDEHNTMSPQMKTYYNTQALENCRPKAIFAQFGDREALPMNHGTTIEWRKRNTFDNVSRLVEGVIPKGKKFGYSSLTADIYEYGDYVPLTDWLQKHAIDPVVLDATEELSAAAMETQDLLVRDELLTGTQVMFAPKADGTEVGDRKDLEKECILTHKVIAKVATQFAKDSVPPIDGHAVAVGIIHPDVAEDLRLSAEWIDFHKYDSTQEIFNGEIGMLHGVRFVVSPNAKVWKGSTDGGKNGIGVYACEFMGKDAYKIIDVAGGNMEMIIKDKNEIGGPLEQFGTVGVKFSAGCKIVYPERIIRVECASSYSDDAVAN